MRKKSGLISKSREQVTSEAGGWQGVRGKGQLAVRTGGRAKGAKGGGEAFLTTKHTKNQQTRTLAFKSILNIPNAFFALVACFLCPSGMKDVFFRPYGTRVIPKP